MIKKFIMKEEEKEAFRKINALPAFRAPALTEYLGYKIVACGVCGIMKFGHLVIPGETRWKCQQCGKCCTGMDGKLTLPAELPKDNTGTCTHLIKKTKKCKIQGSKSVTCRLWPFSFITDNEKHPDPIVVVSEMCQGLGKGEIITDDIYDDLQYTLLRGGQIQDAFKKGRSKKR